MQVFKCALHILKGNLVFPLVYIVGLSFMGLFMAVSFDFGNTSQDYERPAYDYAVIDRDGSVLSQAVADVLAVQGEAVDVPDEKVAIQDAAAKGQVHYLLIIPEGFGSGFVSAARTGEALPELETVYSYYAAKGVFVDQAVNSYLGLVRALCAADPQLSPEDAVAEAKDLAAQESKAHLLDIPSAVSEADRFVFYLQWSTYTLFAGIVVCVGLLTTTMGRADVRRRNLASPLTYGSYNVQLALACAVVTLAAWAWTFCLGLLAFPNAVAQIAPVGLALSALCMLAYCLVPLGLGFLLGSVGANAMVCNAVGNISGMVVSFLGGAWISLDLMTPEVAQAAQWLPGYWYSRACQLSAHIPAVPDAAALGEVFLCLGVLVLFSAAFFAVAALAGKLRTQTADAGGNRAAEAV